MFAGLVSRVMHLGGGDGAAALVARNRGVSIDAAVGWWVDALRDRGPVREDELAGFADALATDLASRLDTTYRVYLEVNHQPAGVLRAAALSAGLDLGAFPVATTMSISDAKVEVSRAAGQPYELLHAA
jgi:hypothetical protein